MEMVESLSRLNAVGPHRGEFTSRPPCPHPLTFDEQRAAEAAFQGWPINPAWSQRARLIYLGLRMVLDARQIEGR